MNLSAFKKIIVTDTNGLSLRHRFDEDSGDTGIYKSLFLT